MNILFDQTVAQFPFYNGAAEYGQAVFLKLVSQLKEYPNVNLYSLYSSHKDFTYGQLSPMALDGKERVKSVDYQGKSLKQVIRENHIDLLFVTCAQTFCELPFGGLGNLGCKVIVVIHDMYLEEMKNSKVEWLHHIEHPKQYFFMALNRVKERVMSRNTSSRVESMQTLIEKNDADIITVSNYSRQSIEYFFPCYASKIHVYYAPMKETGGPEKEIANKELKDLIESKKRFFLLLSADRFNKNGERMIKAFKHYVDIIDPAAIIVTTGLREKAFPQHIPLPYLTSSDMEKAYEHCHALLYPSFFEGFGYPPVEAMRYGKPILASYACSIPEILGNAPIYFSPIYESGMYGALKQFHNTSYESLRQTALKQYNAIKEKQDSDLNGLCTSLLDGSFIK